MQKQHFSSARDDDEPEPSSTGSPLMSWDLIMEGYHSIMRLMEDANRLNEMADKENWMHQWNFRDRILKKGEVVVVTRPDITIAFVTENMYKMNGYFPSEVIGRTPKVFQGELTEADTKKRIREAILDRQPFTAELNNYKKGGELYRCRIEGHPLFNKSGALVSFIAFEKETPRLQ